MPYTRPYITGFVDYPNVTTPLTASVLNTMDLGIKAANDQIQSLTTAQRTTLASTAVVGQVVWDSDLKELFVWSNATGGNAWQGVGNQIICTSATRPLTPFVGQRIYETDTRRAWTYIGSAFVPDDLIFTTEALRDAAITAPFEGMMCYLSAPNIAAYTSAAVAATNATGDTYAAIPTGIQTIYNGTTWVCVTPIGATTNTAGTTSATSPTNSLTSGGTNPSVTLVTGTSASISFGAIFSPSSAPPRASSLHVAVSGATTLTPTGVVDVANVTTGIYTLLPTTGSYSVSRSFILTGLTSGTNVFQLYYNTDSMSNSIRNRHISVVGIA